MSPAAPATPLPLAAALAVLLMLGCGGESAGPRDPDPAPVTVTVLVATTGPDPDLDGYTIALGSTTRQVGPAGSAGFTGVLPGTHSVTLSGLAPNCSVDGGATRQVTVTQAMQLSLAVTCVSVVASGLFTEIACPALAPGASGGMPLARLALGSLPPQLEGPLYARVTGAGSDQYALAFVDRAQDGTATMPMPLHPSGLLEGGPVTIRIAGGVTACATAVSVQLGALPAAPGETAAVVDLLQQLLDRQAGLLGTSGTALRAADPRTVPRPLLPLLVAQSLLDHPGNPNSLRALVNGTAPLAMGHSLETADRLLARVGLRAALQASLPPAAPAPFRAPPAALGAADCLTETITLASELHECMTIAHDAAFRMDGMSGAVQDDIVTVLGYAGNVPHPPAKVAAALLGAAIFVADKLQEGTAMLLPRTFVDIRVAAAPQQVKEDEDATGDWEAEVRATSAGWALDKVVIDALSQLANLSGAWADWMTRYADPDVMQALSGILSNAVVDQAIGSTEGSGIVTYPPQVFGPVDVSDAAWSERSMIPDDIFQFTGHTSYVPAKPGQTQLVVRTRGGLFGGQQITANPPLPLEVEQIGIRLEHQGEVKPVVVATDKKRGFDFSILVTGSRYPDQVVLDPPFPLKGAAFITPGNPATLHYEAPADLTQLPDILVVRHTATTGVRATSTEPRTATVEIRQAQVVVTPGTVCLAPGATQQFDAAVIGLDNDGVTWSASTGSITAGGLYTAPAGLPPGTEVTITATSGQDQDVQGIATVTVGCVCSFSVTVGGQTYDSKPGDKAHYFPDVVGNQGVMSVTLTSVATGRHISLGGFPPPPPVAPGSYRIDNAFGTLAYAGEVGYALFGDDEVTFHLEEYLPHTVLIGSFEGTLRDNLLGRDGPPLAISVVFRIYPTEVFFTRGCTVPAAP